MCPRLVPISRVYHRHNVVWTRVSTSWISRLRVGGHTQDICIMASNTRDSRVDIALVSQDDGSARLWPSLRYRHLESTAKTCLASMYTDSRVWSTSTQSLVSTCWRQRFDVRLWTHPIHRHNGPETESSIDVHRPVWQDLPTT